MLEGTLIVESLRVGAKLEAVPLVVRRITRHRPAGTSPEQPTDWTSLEFEVAEADAERLAETLADALDRPGWYADYRSETEVFVVFPGRVFRYARGDASGRALAIAYGREHGVPEHQLDWPV